MATPVDQKLLKSTKFPPEFSRKVDMTKVNIEVMKKYSRLPRILIATQSVNSLLPVTGGLLVESLKSLAMKMTLSLNCASTSWKALATYVSMDAKTLTRFTANLLRSDDQPNVKELQIQLTGFLDKDTSKFCKELWSLCLSGQENPQGVPKELLEAKKLELMQEKASHTQFLT
jgi:serine/arginine repetitive matrix protein 1